MIRSVLLFLSIFGITLATRSPAAELAPEDFAYGMTITTPTAATAYRVAIPFVVYQKTAREDLRDLRVFNAAGEVVPYELMPPPALPVEQPQGVSLPLFPLRGDSRVTLNGMHVTIQSLGTAVNVEAAGRAAEPNAIKGYIIDARALNFPLSVLRLQWQEQAPEFSGTVRLDSSDDLGSWQTARGDAPVVNLQSANAQLVRCNVAIATPTKAKFWRLTWVGPSAPFELTSVTGYPNHERGVERSSVTVAGSSMDDKHREFSFDLGAKLPVNQINIELPESNSVNKIQLLSRAHPTDAWRPVTAGDFYRIKNGSSEGHNEPIAIARNSDRYWLARMEQPGAPRSGMPNLVATWSTEDVVFLARGKGPFTLAYGNGGAGAATATLNSLLAGITVVRAELGASRSLGGERRLAAPARVVPWKMTVLWSVLVIGVLLLAWMSYRLSRELGIARA